MLTRWAIPVESGGRRAVVRGATSWVPTPRPGAAARQPESGGLLTALLVGGLLAGAGLVAALVLRRRV